MQWHRSGLIASWEFLEEYVERKSGTGEQISDKILVNKDCDRKWGVMVIIKSLQFLPATITSALREATHNLHEALPNGYVDPANHGNMMHVALVGINNQMSLLQDRYILVIILGCELISLLLRFLSIVSTTTCSLCWIFRSVTI